MMAVVVGGQGTISEIEMEISNQNLGEERGWKVWGGWFGCFSHILAAGDLPVCNVQNRLLFCNFVYQMFTKCEPLFASI